MPGDQLTPVISWRLVYSPCSPGRRSCNGRHAKAASMIHGTPSVDPFTVLQRKVSIAQPAASNLARRWSSPMIPSASGRTGLLLVAMAWSRDRTASRSNAFAPFSRRDSGARDSPVASRTAFCLAVPLRPRNSVMNSLTVRSRPCSASWLRYAPIRRSR
jgi:hypothetical protein